MGVRAVHDARHYKLHFYRFCQTTPEERQWLQARNGIVTRFFSLAVGQAYGK